MILKRLILVLLAAFLVMGCVGAVSAVVTSIPEEGGEVGDTPPAGEPPTDTDDDDESSIPTAELIQPVITTFSGNVTSGTAPLAVKFTFSGTNVDSYSLDFGDGKSESFTSTDTGGEHIYQTAGTYTANLTAENGNGTVFKTTPISVTAPLVASFEMSPTSGTAPLEVQFTDISTGSPNAWNWDFGDNYSSSSQSPTHSFSSAGTFTVNLTVSKPGMESNTTSHNIIVNPAPTLTNITSLSITGVTLPVGGATKNTTKPAVSSNPSGSIDSISSITWKNVSDGSTSGTIFNYETVYKAIMTVEAKSGYRFTSGSAATLNGNNADLNPSTDGTSATITYTCPKTAAEGKILPTITTFTVTPASGMSPLKVRFTVATTNATNVTLNFGDGSTPISIKNGYVEHTYSTSTSWSFYPILTATNTNSSVTETRSILVDAPLATSTSTPTPASTPAAASLTTMSLGNVNVPAPLDVIKEFIHLFYSIFDPANYQFTGNES